ncbi:GNAT family N-acetyltransferase [Streptomyces sp. AJS327]|uniref:GNAT family N-acetyltransferase n=1 Tax=Streptomyces sp. AJS327 TaxID=2545265 RepID=UPI0015DEB04A|nr:GNAT family N-acetyltransferase [Streptomyces sp. AJS327]MBA0052850.1 GNAT family N-acetyltransferase [Streptomyces sp. AJS327]
MSEPRYASDPTELPGWEHLARPHTFYAGAPWLRFADTDGLARSHYLCLPGTAALSAHWTEHEVNGGYLAHRMLPGVPEGPALTLGGRRGYLSAPLAPEPPGTTGPFSGDGDPLARLVRGALELEPRAGGHWWWPYLTGPDAARVLAATRAWRPHARLIGADCLLEVPDGGLDAYLGTLHSAQRRTHVRREIQRYAGSGLRTEQSHLQPWITQLGPLLSNVQRKYGHDHSPGQMTDLLQRQAEHLDARSVVFLALDPADPDRPVGFSLAYRHGSELTVRVVGFAYERLRGAGEYAELAVHAPVRYCQEHGLTRLHLGKGSYEAKCRRGAGVRPLWAVSTLPTADGGHPDGARRGGVEDVPAERLAFGLLDRDAAALRTRTDAELDALREALAAD